MENAVRVNEGINISKGLDAFGSIESFENVQRMAKLLAGSTMVPPLYRNNIGNCVIALDVASRVGLPTIMVMQNLYVVNGRPAWGAQTIGALINTSGRYKTPLKYKFEGVGNNLSCYAYAIDWEGEVIKGPTVDMEMARKEGWVGKKDSKWQTMPKIMIQYRATSFFGRMYCSDMLLGIYSEDEVQDFTEDRSRRFEDVKEEVKSEIEEKINEEIIDIDATEIKEVTPIEEDKYECEF